MTGHSHQGEVLDLRADIQRLLRQHGGRSAGGGHDANHEELSLELHRLLGVVQWRVVAWHEPCGVVAPDPDRFRVGAAMTVAGSGVVPLVDPHAENKRGLCDGLRHLQAPREVLWRIDGASKNKWHAHMRAAREAAVRTEDAASKDPEQAAANLLAAFGLGYDAGRAIPFRPEIEEGNAPVPSWDEILIEDGELTFFSILWMLRRMAEGYSDASWIRKAEPWLPVFTGADSPSWTTLGSALRPRQYAAFGEILGLLTPGGDDTYALTHRWFSFVAWLRHVGRILHLLKGREAHRYLWALLPAKHFKDCHLARYQGEFRPALEAFLASDPLRGLCDDLMGVDLCHLPQSDCGVVPLQQDAIPVGQARLTAAEFWERCIVPLAGQLDAATLTRGSLPTAESSPSLFRDHPLIHTCRAPFLPEAFAWRAYQPFASHMVLIAHVPGVERAVVQIAPQAVGLAMVRAPSREPNGVLCWNRTRGFCRPFCDRERHIAPCARGCVLDTSEAPQDRSARSCDACQQQATDRLRPYRDFFEVFLGRKPHQDVGDAHDG